MKRLRCSWRQLDKCYPVLAAKSEVLAITSDLESYPLRNTQARAIVKLPIDRDGLCQFEIPAKGVRKLHLSWRSTFGLEKSRRSDDDANALRS
jgi:hypothetical protein